MADNPKFDPKTMSIKDLKHAPIEVIKTEVTSLSAALGVSPTELFRTLGGIEPPVAGARAGLGLEIKTAGVTDGNTCCNSDSW